MAGEARTVRRKLVRRRDARRKPDDTPAPATPAIPRIARLMACAIVFDEMLARGEVRSYREIAAIAQISPARVSQVMRLLDFAPGFQEAILLLQAAPGTHCLTDRQTRRLMTTVSWQGQIDRAAACGHHPLVGYSASLVSP